MSKRAVVLLSGGIDSSTVLAVARSLNYECYAMSFSYGQRHDIELQYATDLSESLGVQEHIVNDINLRKIGGSALTDTISVPTGRSVEEMGAGIPVTYVPARNTIFLSFAMAWAEVLCSEDIFVGVNALDYSGYPDCRPEYVESFELMANLATKSGVEGITDLKINAPLIEMTKSQIIRKGLDLGVDYGLTWSCYDPQPIGTVKDPIRDPVLKPCEVCDSCLLRAKGFAELGEPDPLLEMLQTIGVHRYRSGSNQEELV